jgi:hypothetical protein
MSVSVGIDMGLTFTDRVAIDSDNGWPASYKSPRMDRGLRRSYLGPGDPLGYVLTPSSSASERLLRPTQRSGEPAQVRLSSHLAV